MFLSNRTILNALDESKLEVGSSKSKRQGSRSTSFPIQTLFLSPPDTPFLSPPPPPIIEFWHLVK